MNNQLISIIIPVYNGEKGLAKAIESVLAQTYTNFELILINDGSKDKTAKICDEYKAKDSRIKVINTENNGLVKARKVGLENSTGQYITYIDHDDFIEHETIEYYVNTLNYTNADIIISGYKEDLANNSSEILLNTICAGLYEKDALIKTVFPQMLYNNSFSKFGINTYVWNKLFKRDLIYDIQMNVDERISIGEDACITYPAILNAKKICITNSAFYHYVQHPASMMKTGINNKKDLERIQYLYSYLKQVFSETPYKDIMLPQLDMYILSLATVFLNGNIKEDNNIFPFKNLLPNSNVILCGAGNFGQHLYKRFSNTKECNITKWVDINHIKYKQIKLPVDSIYTLLKEKYDYVVLAYISTECAEYMKKILLNIGVKEDKIIWLNYNFENSQEVINKMGLV